MTCFDIAKFAYTRFKKSQDTKYLNTLIQCAKKALKFHTTTYDHDECLDFLGSMLQDRCGQNFSMQNLNEAINLHQDALKICVPDHSMSC